MSSSTQPDPLAEAARSLPHGWRRWLGRLSGSTKRPLKHIQVEVTSHCPGACTYCPRGILHTAWQARHMRDACFAALTPLMLQSERVHLQGWGEPFAHPRLLDYVALARKAGCAASTTSCGLVMTEELARRTVESGMDIVAFSLVGTDETSNAPRRNVPFARVAKAVQMLEQARRALRSSTPRIHLSYLLLADRLQATARLPELMEAWNIDMCIISTLDMPVLAQHWAWAYRPEETDKIARARVFLEPLANQAAASGRAIHFCLPGKVTGNCREDIAHSCYVDADGILSPCIYLNVPFRENMFREETLLRNHRVVYGSIEKTSPVDLWNRDDYMDFRADLSHGVTPETCLSCPKRFEHFF